MRFFSRLTLAAALPLLSAFPACAQEAAPPETAPVPHKNGQPVAYPDPAAMKPKYRTYGFLEGAPSAKITAPGKFEIRFKTTEPTPPALVYHGFNTLDEELDYQRYRWYANEQGKEAKTEHVIEVDFARNLKYLPNTPFEPRVVYRVEVFIPRFNSSRIFEGRIYFNPQTKGDTANILVGPFVEQVTPTSAVIFWETDREADSLVRLRSAEGKSEAAGIAAKRAGMNGPHAFQYEAVISGLEPGSRYLYSVRTGDTQTREYSFATPLADVSKFEFATMVDCREAVAGGAQALYGVAGESLYRLGSDAYFRGAEFVLFAGDLINGYTTDVQDFRNMLDSFRRMMGPVNARIPVYESIGNHEALLDTFDDGSRYGLSFDKQGADSAEVVFGDAFCNPDNGPESEGAGTPSYRENVYSFDHGNSRFFMLNNNYWWSSDPHGYGGNLEGYFLPAQLKWLRERVAEADQDPKIKHLFFAAQEPIFPNGGHVDDAMWYNGGDTNGDGKIDVADVPIVENRNEIWEIVAGSPKSVAFITGDEHAYCRLIVAKDTNVGHKRKTDGTEANFKYPVWQITSGGAGAPWYDQDKSLPWTPFVKKHSTQPHYAFFRVDGDNVTVEAYSETGQRIDQAAIRKGGANLSE